MRYVFLVNVGLGLLMIGLAISMILQWVKPNAIYGFRTAKTLSSESVWYAANRFAGAALALAGITIAVGSIMLFWIAGDASHGSAWGSQHLILLWLAMLGVPLTFSTIASFLYLKKL